MTNEEQQKLEQYFEELFLTLPDEQFVSYLEKGKHAMLKCTEALEPVVKQTYEKQLIEKQHQNTALHREIFSLKNQINVLRKELKKAPWSEDEFDKITNKFFGWHEMNDVYKKGIKEALGIIRVQ